MVIPCYSVGSFCRVMPTKRNFHMLNRTLLAIGLFSICLVSQPWEGLAQTASQPPAAAPSAPAPGSGVAWVRENYSKYEYQIPMRDGVKLFTSVYVPKEAVSEGHTYPILLQRTPYNTGPYGVDKFRPSLGPSELFAK